jgi:predicted deacetylase
MSAKFLLRFDDMCPTMNWKVWQKLEDIMLEEEIRPILSVIPDNQDRNLFESEPNQHFWDRVRGWQARGWTIGLHGYQHLYVSKNPGIIGLKNYSEFAGLPMKEQRTKLVLGLEIFAREGVRPEVWVAPAHSFDQNTIKALISLGIRTISDGLSIYPHCDSQGVVWVPQQLWRFRAVPFGVWTVCIHSKDDLYLDSAHFRQRVRAYKHSITNFSAVVADYERRRLSWADGIFGGLWHLAIRAKVALGTSSGPVSMPVPSPNPDAEAPQRLKAAL